MALLEQLWPAVSQALTADGDASGVLTVASTSGYYSGQLVELKGNALTTLSLKVLEVLTSTTLRVGAPTQSYTGSGVSCAGYTVVASATLVAKRQPKVVPGNDEVIGAVYEAQPTSAFRVMTVDRQGNYIDPSGSSSVGVVSITGNVSVVGTVSITNTVTITSSNSNASFQFLKVINTALTVGNASITQAFLAGTTNNATRVITCINSLNQTVGLSLNGSQIAELESAESFSFDLASNGRQINSSVTVGVWNTAATSTSGSIRFIFVS